jgi:hypothetical protein
MMSRLPPDDGLKPWTIKKVEIIYDLVSKGFIKTPHEYYKAFNMTQTELDELLKETIELAKQMAGSLPVQQNFPFMSFDPNDIPKSFSPEVKKECDHTFIQYHGLKETFEYCTKCDVKK